jgi:hypothetical protein
MECKPPTFYFEDKNMYISKIVKTAVASAGIIALSTLAPVGAFNQGNTVTMGGIPIFEINASAEGFSPERRAWQAQDALDNAMYLSSNPGPECVSVSHQNGSYVLRLAGHYIATADGASAAAEGMSSAALANKWSCALKEALSNPERTTAYISTLKDPNKVEGEFIAERKIFAPEGTVLPVAFDQNLNGAQMFVGEKVSGRIVANVPVGSYFIPADSVVIGSVQQCQSGSYSIKMETLRTPNGTEMPIAAVVSDRIYTRAVAPHQVATIGIPANSTTNTRVPAQIGIGAGQSAPVTALTFTRDSGYKISRGEPTNVVLEGVSSVAVVPGSLGM